MSQKQRSRPVRKKPVNTENRHLILAINAHFGYVDGKCRPVRLWDIEFERENEDGTTEKVVVSRYRINWWDWDTNTVCKSVFCYIRDANPDRPENPDKDYEPQYEITEITA